MIFFIPAIIAFLIAIIATPITILLAKRYKLMDDPKTHKHPAIMHTKPTPRAGGAPIYLAILIATLFFIPLNVELIMVLIGGFFVVVVGLLDDKYDLSPYTRFLTNFLIASIPVVGGVTLWFITNPIGQGVISFQDNFMVFADILSVLWIVWTMNMLNWSTGVNGQMPGIAVIAGITIGMLSLRFSQLDGASLTTAQLSFITAAAALGFLFFNFPKAKIFPGYSGTIIGYMLAVLSILSGAKVATALLVMGVPTIDAVFTILRRVSTGHSPFRGDRGHFHHMLIKKGWSVPKIAFFYWALSALLGTIALLLSSRQKLFAIIILSILIGGSLLWLSLFSREDDGKDQ